MLFRGLCSLPPALQRFKKPDYTAQFEEAGVNAGVAAAALARFIKEERQKRITDVATRRQPQLACVLEVSVLPPNDRVHGLKVVMFMPSQSWTRRRITLFASTMYLYSLHQVSLSSFSGNLPPTPIRSSQHIHNPPHTPTHPHAPTPTHVHTCTPTPLFSTRFFLFILCHFPGVV